MDRQLMLCGLLLCAAAMLPTSSAAELLDDFNDGIDERWFVIDTNFELDAALMPILDETGMPIPKPWGPAILDATSGALNMRTTGPLPPDPALPPGDATAFDPLNSGLMALGWGPSAVEPRYSNGRLRATVRADNASNVDLVLRADPSTFSGYVFTGLASLGEFHFNRLDNGLTVRDELVPGLVFGTGEEWQMEFSAVGNEFYVKAWLVGEAEPAAPQLTIFDDTYAFGVTGVIASVLTGSIDDPTPVDATFDDIVYTAVPEPSTAVSAITCACVVLTLLPGWKGRCTR